MDELPAIEFIVDGSGITDEDDILAEVIADAFYAAAKQLCIVLQHDGALRWFYIFLLHSVVLRLLNHHFLAIHDIYAALCRLADTTTLKVEAFLILSISHSLNFKDSRSIPISEVDAEACQLAG